MSDKPVGTDHAAGVTTDPARRLVRVCDPATLVEVIPSLLGFRPERSAVFVGMSAPGADTGMQITVTVRIDFAGLYDSGELTPVVDALHRSGATRVVTVLYLDEVTGDPRHDLLLQLAGGGIVDRLKTSGLAVTDLLVASPTRWWSLLCEQEDCCPPEGKQRSTAGLEDVLGALDPPAQSREEALAILEPVPFDPDLAADMGQVATRNAFIGDTEQQVRVAVRKICDYARGLAEGHEDRRLSRDGLVQCAAALAVLGVRDRIWTLIDAREEPHAELAALALQVATRAPGVWAAPGYFLWAWEQWRDGRGMEAQEAAMRALEADSDYSAAVLLLTAIHAGLNPISIPKFRQFLEADEAEEQPDADN